VKEEKLQALSDYENSRVFAAEELAVLRYADALTATPVDVSDETFAAVRAIYDDAQIVELTSALAWENYRARFDHALKIEAEGFSEGAFCPLPISLGATI
jgi:alkylhydroperoxidase family enzyme